MAYTPTQIAPLYFYCQKILPAVFDDSLSYYEQLCKLTDKVNEIIEMYGPESETIKQVVERLNQQGELLDDIASGKYADLYIEQLGSYIDANLVNFVARLAYYLFPGLQYDSNRNVWRYVLKIPSSWKWLKFTYIWDEEKHAWYIALKY